jgi:hypothetical protein
MAAILVVKLQIKSVQRRAAGWTTCVRFPTVEKEFSLLYSVHIGCGVYSAPCSMCANGSLPGGKRLGREAGHSARSNVEVKNSGAILILPHTSSWRYAI